MGAFVLCFLLLLESRDVGLRLGALPALQRPLLAVVWCPEAEQTPLCPALRWVSAEGNTSSAGQSLVLITPGLGIPSLYWLFT